MVLLLSWDSHLDFRDRLTAATITSQIRGLDSEVFLDSSDGVPRACVVNLDSIGGVWRNQLYERVTELGEAKMLAVERGLHRALGMALPCHLA
jgi:mRNA interferase MazF